MFETNWSLGVELWTSRNGTVTIVSRIVWVVLVVVVFVAEIVRNSFCEVYCLDHYSCC